MNHADALDLFLPAVRQWFRTALGTPTPPQQLGWPSIAAGNHTLILAPTGSGKTLAAFLACLDRLWRHPPELPGVRVLYISPLKALNNDIHRNLQIPLEGVAETARCLGQPLPEIRTAVRTGDTPTAERQHLVRKPPHVLITTPESLHLLLTSRAGIRCGTSRTSSSMRFTPSAPTSAASSSPCSWNVWKQSSATAHSSASACRRRSGRWTRSPATSAVCADERR